MCISCGDFVDLCFECLPDEPGRARSFYVDDVYCKHFQVEYGHYRATWEDMVLDADCD